MTYKKITREQVEEIMYAIDSEELHKLLNEYAGIIAKPYTAYAYYDEEENYLGDSDNYDVMDLLESAYIKVEG